MGIVRFTAPALFAFVLGFIVSGGAHATVAAAPIHLKIDASEADQVIRILRKSEVSDDDWKRLFETEPYRWLKEREASIGAAFSDEEFKAFVRSDEARARLSEWESVLRALKKADAEAIGKRVLEWLPPGATIRARVFPEIKPRHNSFVWTKPGSGPAIFLALQAQTLDQFENTVAHECHHIGLRSLEQQQNAARAGLPSRIATAMEWMTAFGEGESMLAAAGSAARHPHSEDDALVRARWDADMMHFDADAVTLQQLFTEILDGTLQGEDAIRKRAAPFWGDAQGAWYTVGYEMSVLVEKRFGRRAFLECLIDPRQLLILYNKVAIEANANGASLRLWSPEFISRLTGP